ncbi:ATP-binding cassette domain-containing protein [Halovenus sp. WSH3]|uniref:ATP-binding cassette domain-containing protein n=1 Tax=Halovenus carboxidivorans TaxID=2692199 RepID=A0A6B0SYU1_9EURY|nr:phosphonate ABC transporter ATP-binding protein [Halovenus carboxidivorans]MXR50764.1 ATP-binding cassette domain-containing protein [Halovenus carboxidivorans]
MSKVSFDGVRKVYNEETVALDGIDCTIEDGEFVVLLGPSGAGKSTLLRVLNGLTMPTEGEVTIDGEPVQGEREDVAMVFQMHYLVESMSAFKNALTGGLSREGLGRSLLTLYDREEKMAALDALDTVGLLDEAEQRAGSMSGGQKQRVGIARALVQEPELLLADEPVSSLDPKAARDVMRYMKTASEERGLTTVASLHQVDIARKFGDRFLGVRDGELIFDGTRDELTMDVFDRIYYGEEGASDRSERDSERLAAPTRTSSDSEEATENPETPTQPTSSGGNP